MLIRCRILLPTNLWCSLAVSCLWLLGSTALALNVMPLKIMVLRPGGYYEGQREVLAVSTLLTQQDSLDWQIPPNKLSGTKATNPKSVLDTLWTSCNDDTDSLHRLLEIAYPITGSCDLLRAR